MLQAAYNTLNQAGFWVANSVTDGYLEVYMGDLYCASLSYASDVDGGVYVTEEDGEDWDPKTHHDLSRVIDELYRIVEANAAEELFGPEEDDDGED